MVKLDQLNEHNARYKGKYNPRSHYIVTFNLIKMNIQMLNVSYIPIFSWMACCYPRDYKTGASILGIYRVT